MPAKKLETVYTVTVSANVTSLLITPPALDDPANPNRFSNTHPSHSVYKDLINFFNFSDKISAW